MNPTTNNPANNLELVPLQRKYSFESFKQSIFKKFEALTGKTHERRTLEKASSASFSAAGAGNLDVSQDVRSLRSMVSMSIPLPFQPSLVKTMSVSANIGFNYGANVYNQKHNMIITCPSNSHVHFFDATEMGPMKKRGKKTIDSSVVQMSYCDDTDTHLMGCAFGDIYAYDATSGSLSKVMKQGDSFILGITHITPTTYAFSSSRTNMLYFADMEKPAEQAKPHYSLNSDSWYLHNMREQNVLLSGLANGKIAIYDTSKASKGGRYPMVDSVQAHKVGKYVTSIIDVKINGKNYVVTGGNDHSIKIWQFTRGKMRMLKNIQASDDVSTIVYLENYKMIATTHHKDYINFYKLPFGKLECTLPLGLTKARNIFLMADKNKVGVADLTRNVIKIVQLHQSSGSFFLSR